jgi:hypothetical protein
MKTSLKVNRRLKSVSADFPARCRSTCMCSANKSKWQLFLAFSLAMTSASPFSSAANTTAMTHISIVASCHVCHFRLANFPEAAGAQLIDTKDSWRHGSCRFRVWSSTKTCEFDKKTAKKKRGVTNCTRFLSPSLSLSLSLSVPLLISEDF